MITRPAGGPGRREGSASEDSSGFDDEEGRSRTAGRAGAARKDGGRTTGPLAPPPPAPRRRPRREDAERERPPRFARATAAPPDEAPLRAELYSVAQLEQHARQLASWHELADGHDEHETRLLDRLAANELALHDAYDFITDAVKLGRRITPAAEWFIDNYHLVDEQIRTARRHLPRGFHRELPRLANGPGAGMPRVHELALELISHSHGRVDSDSLRAFIAAYESVEPLRLGELWAIPIMLRLALLENLRRIVAGVTAGRRDRERAGAWVERMLETAATDPAKVVLVLAELVESDPLLTNAFVSEMASRLQGQGPALAFPVQWLEQRLAERGQTVEHVFQLATQSQAADGVAIGNTIGSLRSLAAIDWRDFVEAMSTVERTLREDPAGVYASMDFRTRDQYRHVIERIARRSPLGEDEVAAQAIELARAAPAGRTAHVGYWIIDEGRPALERAARARLGPGRAIQRFSVNHRLELYLGAIFLWTGAITLGLTYAAPTEGQPDWAVWLLAALLAVSTSRLVTAIVQWSATLLVPPRPLPRLDFEGGIPAEHHTLVAVPTMLTDAAEIDALCEALEVRHLANPDPHLSLALVTDFRDAPSEHLESDAELLAHAREGIERLNQRHGSPGKPGPFYLFHRARRHNPREGVWMGWERKRGKLEQLNAALRGRAGGFDTIVGDLADLQDVKYVIALDSDTELPRDAARELAGTLAHPLNRPVFDERLGRVVAGYTILQPRVAVTMRSATATRFAHLFAGEPGIDPYTRAVSDVYQDVFAEGSFVGKGIYDVDAFIKATAGKLPENRILSHDLLEGAHARAALVSEVLLFEDFPAHYQVDATRRLRWTRGDWQITPWLGRSVPGEDGRRVPNPVSHLSQWKIFDNLRRSLVPVALCTLLVGGWLVATPGAALFGTLVVLAILVLPGLLAAAAELARRPTELPRHRHAGEIARTLGRQLVREGFALATLPHDAFISVVAIARTFVRVLITRRKLLEWRTAADAARAARHGLGASYAALWILPVTALAAAAAVALREPDSLPVAAPMLLLWAAAPALVHWMGQPVPVASARLAADDLAFLRRLARRTWRFFETFVGPTDNYLPPDNFQEEPPVGAAHRTSPTNIGLSLLANLTAYDFGYVASGEVIRRVDLTLHTLERMKRFRTHFYNWYDTKTLEPLLPMYVSTVDSGNLAGHLVTLASGIELLTDAKIVRAEIFAGLADTLDVMAEVAGAHGAAAAEIARLRRLVDAAPSGPAAARRVLAALHAGKHEPARLALTRAPAELAEWAHAFDSECERALAELDHVAPWAELPLASRAAEAGALAPVLERLEEEPPSLRDATLLPRALAPLLDEAVERMHRSADGAGQLGLVEELRARLALAAKRAEERLAELRQLAARCRELADLDVDFLYDADRKLFSIGYNVADHRLDASFYDLLASEARLASFVAISQGKLPQEHWFSLGRLLTTTGGKPALLSWSGSMFEYLMPLLVMPTYPRTILDETYHGVIERQMEYARDRGVPWGVSESGYYKTDQQLNYQYRAFGVPGLGFKRGLADDLVIAPYASAMAMMVAPDAACANLRRLAKDGQLGPYGFYEAVDYTPERLPRGKESVTVRSYMAHHQGMAFLALDYALNDRPMQRRFEADPAFRAHELLLQERVPRTPSLFPHPAEVSASGETITEATNNLRVFTTPDTPTPAVQLLSNGNYHVAVTNSGGGYSRWRNLAVTRWVEDATRDGYGIYGYLRDVGSGSTWSVAHVPTLVRPDTYEAIFSLGRAEFRRQDGEIVSHVEISVSPEDDVELRRVSLTNTGKTARRIELTTFAEVVLAPAAADVAHPAFSNLFVESELLEERQAILCTRRPRSGSEKPPTMLHLVTVQGTAVGEASYETSRPEFVGRGRTPADPQAMHREKLSGTSGSVLDPAIAIRATVEVKPEETVRFHIVTGVAETRAGAVQLVEKYSDRHAAERVFELAWTTNQVLLRRLDTTEADTQLFERLAGHVLYASAALRAPRSVIARNRLGQAGLWPYSISGDLPIVLLRVGDREHLPLVRQLVQAHAYWRLKGLSTDLVIWNEDPSGYRQAFQDEMMAMIGTLSESALLDKPGGIFVRRIEQLSEEDRVLMQTVARVILSGDAGSLADQVNRRPASELQVPKFTPARRRLEPVGMTATGRIKPGAPGAGAPAPADAPLAERRDLSAWNGHGGFTHDGREYVITTTRGQRTPAPWVNVLANPYFGTVVSESGGAYTWCENARSYRLTPWYNDPVSDPSGEAFYLRDEDDGRFWSPTPLPAPGPRPYITRHGFGYSVFEYAEDGLASELTTYVATDAPIKFCVLKLKNHSGRARRLSVTGAFDLVLGENRAASALHVVSEVDPSSGALFARNAYAAELAPRVAFLDCSEPQRTVTGDRAEVLGRNGTPSDPACLKRARLSGNVGAALDPCLAMQVELELADGQERELVFSFGSGRDLGDARTLVHRFRGTGAARGALEAVWSYWNRTLGAVNVQTPDASLNFLANGWLVYQVLASRLWGRSGFYQSGGAFGFRDQLQDVMALVHAEPALLREQIVRSAARQFVQGDVQHWWHPPLGRGVRTRISDDYLFLPSAVCRYVATIGDTGVLDEKIGFLEGRPVKPDEESYYDLPLRSEQQATLYDHCVRAIEHGLRFGAHGLPLMGSGDWNDGMNLVGDEGHGESVWLAFFLYEVLVDFGKLAERRGDAAFATKCAENAKKLAAAIEAQAWDGAWYRRAYFDDGSPLGSKVNPECQIDSLPQSWAVLTGAVDPTRSAQALDALDQRLVRRDLGLIQLFDPPFDRSDMKPGYVKGYLPGVRENGGQYTHAAVWAVMAFAAAGQAERAWELFGLINPVRHGASEEAIATYKVEPYVLAADVYTNPQHAGRGGWTWYTGSAGWMYRLIVESLLGLELQVDRLRVEPLLPAAWDGFEVHYRHRDTVHHVKVRRVGGESGGRSKVVRVRFDGVDQPEKTIPLREGGEHHVEVEVTSA